MDSLPSELFSHFDLSLFDLQNIYLINKFFYRSIKESYFKINTLTIINDNFNTKWIKFLNNVKFIGKDLSIIKKLGASIYAPKHLGNVHTLDLSHTKVTDVSALGNVHTFYFYRN